MLYFRFTLLLLVSRRQEVLLAVGDGVVFRHRVLLQLTEVLQLEFAVDVFKTLVSNFSRLMKVSRQWLDSVYLQLLARVHCLLPSSSGIASLPTAAFTAARTVLAAANAEREDQERQG